MPENLKSQAVQIILVFVVFLLFISNGCGLLEIQFNGEFGLSIRSFLLNKSAGQSVALPNVIFSTAFIVLFITGMILSVVLPILNPIQASLLTAVASLLQLYVAYVGTANSLMPLEYCLLTILMLYAVNVLISYFRETVVKQKIVDVFGQFIPPELVAEISRHPDKLKMEGESKHLTVFFCDLQNFTGVAEQLNPKQLARLLNEYFNVMTEILYSHGATIDKYIGDSIMTFWGAPLTQEDHAKRAVLSSLDMQDEIGRLSESFIKRGWPRPSMGIGINTGMMSVGNMGSKYRITYTVVGDAVNLAARLETLTRSYHVPTIVSETTMKESSGIIFRALDVVQVKGKHNKTKIFEPLCKESDVNENLRLKLNQHQQAMDLYFSEDWQQAQVSFGQLKKAYAEDLYYPVMLDKIASKT
ncbi:MAG: adenylate cyclase [Gammaproteobacteria bacterium]|jgi:adenylate cyclase